MGSAATSRQSQWVAVIKRIVQLLVVVLVGWGIWRTVVQAQEQFQAENFSWSQVSPLWLLLAGGLYIGGMLPAWLFWHRTLQAMGQRPRLSETLKAFFIGHLGKYVPGKALVVVLRTGLIRSDRVDTTVAATSVFVETLTMMAVGALMASLVLVGLYAEHFQLLLLALVLILVVGLPTLPPIFRKLVWLLQVRRANAHIETALEGINYRLMAYGWITMALGWLLMGGSLGATLWSLGGNIPHSDGAMFTPPALSDLPLLTACVALAMVAGFLSLLPGGLGVRELVVMTLLTEPYGPVAAIVSAILLRLVWLLSEVFVSSILYLYAFHSHSGLQRS